MQWLRLPIFRCMGEMTIRVLVVDDDEDMRATLVDFISTLGVEVNAAGSLADAERALRAESPHYDLILTDLRLPGGSGMDVLRAAHARHPETLVTIVTGYASLETAIEAIRLGAYDYITKPFTLDEIGVQVRNMIARVSLAKENAHLSIRLQQLFEQVNRLQSERASAQSFQDVISRELQQQSRKLDLILAVLNKSGLQPRQ
jgi:two-component system, NtrC family, response regulator PilR